MDVRIFHWTSVRSTHIAVRALLLCFGGIVHPLSAHHALPGFYPASPRVGAGLNSVAQTFLSLLKETRMEGLPP